MSVLPRILVTMFATAIFLSCTKTDHNTAINDVDRNFVLKASAANKSEIGTGTLAASQGMRDSIRIFGSATVITHTTIEATLDSIATLLNLPTSHGPDSLHQVIISTLMLQQGYTFDTAYIHGQVRDHQTIIQLFQDEITDGTNKKLQDFVGRTLPQLQLQYNMALSISQTE